MQHRQRAQHQRCTSIWGVDVRPPATRDQPTAGPVRRYLACRTLARTTKTCVSRKHRFIDGVRIRKARTLRSIEPIYEHLAVALATIPQLHYIKLFPGRLTASNQLYPDGKKNPVVAVGKDGITGTELLIDSDTRVVQFYAITSAERGCGRKIVEALVRATPADWLLAVPLDWSGGSREHMAQDHPPVKLM